MVNPEYGVGQVVHVHLGKPPEGPPGSLSTEMASFVNVRTLGSGAYVRLDLPPKQVEDMPFHQGGQRPTVNDRVKVRVRYFSKIGRIRQDDHDDRPYQVDFEDGTRSEGLTEKECIINMSVSSHTEEAR